MTAAEAPLFIYVFGSVMLFAWTAFPVKRSRREIRMARLAKKLHGESGRGIEYLDDLLPAAHDRLDRWARPFSFLSANVLAPTVLLLYAVAVNESADANGPDAFGWSSIYLMLAAALAVSALLLRRFLIGEERPLRDLRRPEKIWLGATIAIALLALMVWANRPI